VQTVWLSYTGITEANNQPENTMKAYEQKKDVKAYGNDNMGTIWMIVEGDEAQVKAVCAILDKEFDNDTCPDDDAYSEGYFISREDKPAFMAAYKKAKAATK
jgi:hypothetical protein